MSPQTTIDQYSALVGATLTRGHTTVNQPIGAAGGTAVMEATVGGEDVITVTADMSGAAVGDLTIACLPYEVDGFTVVPVSLVPIPNTGVPATVQAGRVYEVVQYNVQGIDKVRIVLTNNNAAAQTINASWRTENY